MNDKELIPCKEIEITPEVLKSAGWEFRETRQSKGLDPAFDIYLKYFSEAIAAKKNGGWLMDGYEYKWTLYIPSIKYGPWQYPYIIIEENKIGGFAGTDETYGIFRGKCPYLSTLYQIQHLTGIK